MKWNEVKRFWGKVSQKALVCVIVTGMLGGSLAGCGMAKQDTALEERGTDSAVLAQADALLDTIRNNADRSAGGNGKEETVYIFADNTGKVTSTVVSGWLKNPEGLTELTDRTDAENIVNVKGDEAFEKKGDEYCWQAGGKDIYYQGSTDREAPITEKITYLLDDKEISASELVGKSGRVTIRFEYENHQLTTAAVNGKEEQIAAPFAVVTGMVLNDSFSNIEVENGRVVSDGKNSVVVGFALPGLEKSLKLENIEEEGLIGEVNIPDFMEVRADVEDFALDMTLTVAAPSADLSFDEVLDFSELDEKIATLTDASAQLSDGTGELADGIKTLQDSMGDFQDGIGKLKDGITDYADGTGKLSDGIGEVKDGAESLDSGAGELADGIGTLNGGVGDLKAGIDSAKDGAQKLAEGINGPEGAINGVKQLKDGAAALKDGAPAALEGSRQVEGGIKTLVGALSQGVNPVVATVQQELLGKERLLLAGLYPDQNVGQMTERELRGLAQADRLDAQAQAMIGKIVAEEAEAILKAGQTGQINMQNNLDEAYLRGYEAGLLDAEEREDEKEAETEEAEAEEETEMEEETETKEDAENGGETESKGTDASDRNEGDGGQKKPDASGNESAGEEPEDKKPGTDDGGDHGHREEQEEGSESSAADEGGNASGSEEDSGRQPEESGSASEEASSSENGEESQAEDAENHEEEAAEALAAAYFGKTYRQTDPGMGIGEWDNGNWQLVSLAQADGADAGQGADLEAVLTGASARIAQIGGAKGAVAAIEEMLDKLAPYLQSNPGSADAGNELQKLLAGAQALTRGLETLTEGTQQLYGGVARLSDGMDALGSGASELSGGMGKLSDGGTDLAEGVSRLQDGSAELKEGTQRLKDGAQELSDGAWELTGHSAELLDGAQELSDGTQKATDGVDVLYGGAGSLLDGMLEFDRDGIQKIADAYNGDIKSLEERVKAISDAGTAYDNFCGKAEDAAGSVKFIIRTEGVK